MELKYHGFQWATKVIAKIINTSLDLWDYRNKILRGFNYADAIFIHRQKLQKIISNAYTHHQDHVESHHQDLFTKPFHTLIKHSVPYLYTWTTHFEVAYAEWKRIRNKENKYQINRPLKIGDMVQLISRQQKGVVGKSIPLPTKESELQLKEKGNQYSV